MLALLSLLAVLGTLAACSSGSAGADSARAQYLAKAEAVCSKANADQAALRRPTSSAELSPYVDAIVRLADRTTTALLLLRPPGRDKADLEEHVFGPLHGQLVTLRRYADKVRSAARAHDQIALVRLLSDPPTETAADLAWMRHYGFRACVDAADTTR